MSPASKRILASASSLLLAVAARADDWPQFRGPGRDNVWREAGVVEALSPMKLEVLWRQPVRLGWSSPVVAGGRVFVTDALLEKPAAHERVLAFDEATGKPLWTFSYEETYPEWCFEPEHASGPAATPVAEAGRLYAVGANGHVHCLDAEKGEVLWEKAVGKEYRVRALQCRPSPLIEGDLLIVFTGAEPGASLLALDRRTGKEVWKALEDPVSNSSPIVVEAGGRRQLIVWTDKSITSLSPSSGETYWREAMVTSNNDSIATPVVWKDRLLISGLMMRLDAERPAATVLWPETHAASRRILSNTSTPFLRGDHVYSARSSGELVCLEAATGKEVWTNDTVTDLEAGASVQLTGVGDAFLLFTDRGDLIAARLSPAGYRELSRTHLIDPTSPFGPRRRAWTPPAYAHGCVFARSDQELVCASLGARP